MIIPAIIIACKIQAFINASESFETAESMTLLLPSANATPNNDDTV